MSRAAREYDVLYCPLCLAAALRPPCLRAMLVRFVQDRGPNEWPAAERFESGGFFEYYCPSCVAIRGVCDGGYVEIHFHRPRHSANEVTA